jgi:TolA-binding protein
MLGMFSGFSTSARRVTGFFQQSRDAWKSRAAEYQLRIRKLNVRVYDLEKSRERWKAQAQQTKQKLAELELQLASRNSTQDIDGTDTAAPTSAFSICR